MGHRTIKRVPVGFNWPLEKVWRGYINPNRGPRNCESCGGTGHNPATRQLEEDYYDHRGHGIRWHYEYGVAPDGSPAAHPPWKVVGEKRAWHTQITQDEVLALVESNRLWDFTHRIVPGQGWQQKTWDTKGFWCPRCHTAVPQLSEEHLTSTCTCSGIGDGKETQCLLLPGTDIRLQLPRAEDVDAWEEHGGLHGHDAINSWILVRTRAKRLGIWGKCTKCRGRGESRLPRKLKKAYKKWQPYEPPTGEGWQLWETVSEGSPMTPAFGTAEELAKHCAATQRLASREDLSVNAWYTLITGKKSMEVGSMLIGDEATGAVGSGATMLQGLC